MSDRFCVRISRDTCVSAAGEAYRLFYHPKKGQTSRSIRRFLELFAYPSASNPGSSEIRVAFASYEGYTPEQEIALIKFARGVQTELVSQAQRQGVRIEPLDIEIDLELGVIAQSYLLCDIQSASLKALRGALEAFAILADLVTPLAVSPNADVFHEALLYLYRNAPRSICLDESLWQVSGSDELTGCSGVLE